MLSEPQPLSARADFEDFAATRSGPPPPSHRAQGRRPVPSKLRSNKLPVVGDRLHRGRSNFLSRMNGTMLASINPGQSQAKPHRHVRHTASH